MNNKKLGKEMNRILDESREKGVNFSKAFNNCYSVGLIWDRVRKNISDWEDKGKIICLNRGNPINNGTYTLTKYAPIELR